MALPNLELPNFRTWLCKNWHCQPTVRGPAEFGTTKLPDVALPNLALMNYRTWQSQTSVSGATEVGTAKLPYVHCQIRHF